MRNLTIKRNKSFVGSLLKTKIYIEDPMSEDIQINGVSCRKLGEIKNGEEKTFSIGSGEAKVFAIADKLSRGYCNDYYPLPAGDEDVNLTGKMHYNPGAGNPFRFDGVTDETVLANRKKNGRKGLGIIVAAAIVGGIVGFAVGFAENLDLGSKKEPREFNCQGMTITLTEAFEETEPGNYTACYESKNTMVFALKEEFTIADGFEDYTLEEYGQLVMMANGMEDELNTTDGVMWFTYTYDSPEHDQDFYYFATVHKGNDAFWLIQFATTESLAEQYMPQFLEWAKTVTFS